MAFKQAPDHISGPMHVILRLIQTSTHNTKSAAVVRAVMDCYDYRTTLCITRLCLIRDAAYADESSPIY